MLGGNKMKVTCFITKDQASAYQKEHGGRILWGEWSQKRGSFTDRGREYNRVIAKEGLFLTSDHIRKFIVVEDE